MFKVVPAITDEDTAAVVTVFVKADTVVVKAVLDVANVPCGDVTIVMMGLPVPDGLMICVPAGKVLTV